MKMDRDTQILEDFRKWLRDQPFGWAETVPFDDQADDFLFDSILEFCRSRKYSEKTTETLLDWILLRNEVFVFLEEQGIRPGVEN